MNVVIPPEAMARFTAAEARLYPMAISDPDGYERAATVVGLVAAELRVTAGDVPSVLDGREAMIARLPQLAAGAGLAPPAGLAAEIVDAAAALRCRELQAEGATARWNARADAARAAGEVWLVEKPDPMAVLSGSYRSVEWHLPTSTTLISAIEAGRAAEPPTYTIDVVERDGVTDSSSYPDRKSWLAAAERLRTEISRRSGNPARDNS
jgi:hypothetical protein